MERRLFIARRLVERGLVPKATIEDALRRVDPAADLLELLHVHKLISRDDFVAVRQEADARFGDATILDTRAANESGLPAEIVEERKRLQELAARVFEHSPHFSPLFDTVYERKDRLGAGGMGDVFRVHDRRLGREVAIKVLRAAPGDLDAVQRFLREIHLTARLVHPGIPPVYEAGRTPAGERFFAMQVIEGDTLKQKIAAYHEAGRPRERLRPLLVALVKAADTVAYAHSRRIVHRDLKPSNIMIGAFGEVYVMDWGVAKDLGDDAPESNSMVLAKGESTERLLQPDLTEAGASMGTPGYMAPEQASAKDVDERADVFALGAILCDILTGEPPYRPGRIKAALAAMLARPLEGLRQRVADIPPELEALAMRALALNFELRIQSAARFGEELRAYLAGGQLSVYRYGFRERARRWVARHPSALLGVIFGALFLGTVSVYAARLSLAEKVAAERAGAVAFVEAINQAQKELDRKAVIASLEKAVASAAKRAEACLIAGRLCQDQGFLDDAERFLTAAYEAEAPGYEALYALHNLDYERSPRAMSSPPTETRYLDQILKQALRRGDSNAYVSFARAIRSETRGDLDAAARSFGEAARSQVISYWPYIGLARVSYKLGRMDDAERAARRALEINSRAASAHFTLGAVLTREDDLDEAIRALNRGLDLAPRNKVGLYNRAVVRELQRDDLAAHRDFSAVLEVFSGEVEALLGKLRTAAKLGLWDSMPADLERAEDLVKTPLQRATLLHCRAELYGSRRQKARRFEALQKAWEADPGYQPSAVAFASALLLERRYREAASILDAVIARDPRCAPALDIRSQVHRFLGDDAAAETDVSRAIALQPKNAKLYFSRADLRQRLSRVDEARRDLDRAEALDPKLGDPHVIRGVIAEREGDLRAALAAYREAARLGLRYLPTAFLREALSRLGAGR